MSKGTFGSKIALELLKMGNEIVFFCAEGSRTPFKMEVDMLNNQWAEDKRLGILDWDGE